jgi:hypothetical protein
MAVAAELQPSTMRPDILDLVTAAKVKSIFPTATTLTNITRNLPFCSGRPEEPEACRQADGADGARDHSSRNRGVLVDQ